MTAPAFDYLAIAPIAGPIQPKKQGARRHYGSHPYFTKRAWNVVQEYIKTFTKPGDTVLDPYGGSGVTAIEALVLRRKAIHVDISPLANFLAQQIAAGPLDLSAVRAAYAQIDARCRERIQQLYTMEDAAISAMEVPEWYPKDIPLPSNADVERVEDCFHRRSLIGLSILLAAIRDLGDSQVRQFFKVVFAATLVKTNLTFSSTAGRLESRGDSAIFRLYRYWIPPQTIELNVWDQFKLRFAGMVAAKAETNAAIGDFYKDGDTARFEEASATNLRDVVPNESVDYIYTDPPYGAHIAYLDLSTMWHAWLQMDVSDTARQLEVIEGGDLQKTKDDYERLLTQSIDEMFRVSQVGQMVEYSILA